MFDFNKYAARTGSGLPEPTLDGLFLLQRSQLATIPFEGIDPFTGMTPNLHPDHVFRKLVESKRGGYCFELNWLLGEALKHVGFTIRPILGRVRMGQPVGGFRGHLAWIVTLDGKEWLADSGFGGPGPRDPLELREGVHTSGNTNFRFRRDDATNEWVLERQNPDGWFGLFGFNEDAFTAQDIEAANFLCAQSPYAPFPANLMMSIRLAGEDVSLFNLNLQRAGSNGVQVMELSSASELETSLRHLFGIACDRPTIEKLWDRLKSMATPVAA